MLSLVVGFLSLNFLCFLKFLQSTSLFSYLSSVTRPCFRIWIQLSLCPPTLQTLANEFYLAKPISCSRNLFRGIYFPLLKRLSFAVRFLIALGLPVLLHLYFSKNTRLKKYIFNYSLRL